LAAASSTAGNQVQRQIFVELHKACADGDKVCCFSMAPQPFWPKGPLISPTLSEDGIDFIGYLNLPMIKHVVFATRLLIKMFKLRPALSLQYNSYLAENLALLALKARWPRGALVSIVQDVNVRDDATVFTKGWFRSWSERISLRLLSRFDGIFPISQAIIDDFDLPSRRSHVFQGGVTEFAMKLAEAPVDTLLDIGLFAGALEPHNGIDVLVNAWLAQGIEQPLHVFGRGSLQSMVSQAAAQSEKIVYHGFQSEEVILMWQRQAKWNFCLRYSQGLDERYFFPSKFFNVMCAPGGVIVNDFKALPGNVRKHLCVAANDLSDLEGCLAQATTLAGRADVAERRQKVLSNHSWTALVQRVLAVPERYAS
jgi:glycosyltransferase involved in cell wall biosynthesis